MERVRVISRGERGRERDRERARENDRGREREVPITTSKMSHLVRSHVRLLRKCLAANFTLVFLLLRVHHLVSVQIATLAERLVALSARIPVDVSACEREDG